MASSFDTYSKGEARPLGGKVRAAPEMAVERQFVGILAGLATGVRRSRNKCITNGWVPLSIEPNAALSPASLISRAANNYRRICVIDYAVDPRHNRNPPFDFPRSGTTTLGNSAAVQKQKHIIAVLLGCD
jgi:hypothetical protein